MATGGSPIVPPLDGIHGANVMTASEVLLSKKLTGKNVIVIGGGEVGAETALKLALGGKSVTFSKFQPARRLKQKNARDV